MIDAERVTRTFLDLVQINSPSKQERRLADYVKGRLVDLGMQVKEDDAGEKIGGNAGNVIGFLPGTDSAAAPIFLSAHMDTVEPTDALNLVIEGDIIKTDGSTILGADDKAGITAILEGFADVLNRGIPRGDVHIIFSICEEQGLRGATQLDHSIIRGKMGYVFDTGMPVAGLIMSAPTHDSIMAEIHGKAAHAGVNPEDGISAIVAASKAISKMKLGRIDNETTANIGRIEGGKARNIVPDTVRVSAEARSLDNAKLDVQTAHMKSTFEQEAAAMGAIADVTIKRQYFTYRWTQNDALVKIAAAASTRVGIEPKFLTAGGGSDANIYNAAGIPAMVVGTAYTGPHATSEQASIGGLVKTSEFVAALVESAAAFSGN